MLTKIARKFFLTQIEKLAIKWADSIIVPSLHAMDSYYTSNRSMQKLLTNKKKIEIPSGIYTVDTQNFENKRSEFISNSKQLLIGYFGRYNYDKGFDIFKNLVDKTKHSNVRFISGGTGELERPSSCHYKDLGWRTDALELINSCDIIIVPNNIAYFDLIILEALSMGKYVITTYVGGSKSLVQGIVNYLYLDKDVTTQFDDLLDNYVHHDKIRVKSLFEKNYTCEAMAKRYSELGVDLK